MKVLIATMALALLLASQPVLASQTAQDVPMFPDTADSIKQPRTRTNFNTYSFGHKENETTFPQGKNSFAPPTERVVSSAAKPKKPICVGNDCGCTSGKNR
jgi:hypothetical protein